jgi:hypothetical protein
LCATSNVFQLGYFSERNSDIHVSTKFSHKYTENFWNVTALFFVKNLNRSTNIITTNTEYTIDPQSKIEETTLYYYQTLEVGNTIQWILLWKGSSPVHLPLRGDILLLSYSSQYNNSLHIPLHCLNPFI